MAVGQGLLHTVCAIFSRRDVENRQFRQHCILIGIAFLIVDP